MFTVAHIPLSPREAELLDHRLGSPDAIADVLGDDFSRPLVVNAADRLRLFVKNRIIPTAHLGEVDEAVLADAIEGSTWVAGVLSESDDPEIARRAVRTIKQLALKLKRSGIVVESVPLA